MSSGSEAGEQAAPHVLLFIIEKRDVRICVGFGILEKAVQTYPMNVGNEVATDAHIKAVNVVLAIRLRRAIAGGETAAFLSSCKSAEPMPSPTR